MTSTMKRAVAVPNLEASSGTRCSPKEMTDKYGTKIRQTDPQRTVRSHGSMAELTYTCGMENLEVRYEVLSSSLCDRRNVLARQEHTGYQVGNNHRRLMSHNNSIIHQVSLSSHTHATDTNTRTRPTVFPSTSTTASIPNPIMSTPLSPNALHLRALQ
jgi:hypothetical protein